MHGRLTSFDFGIETDEWVDLEVSKLEMDVDGIEPNDEIDERVTLGGGHVDEKGVGDGGAGGERGRVDGDGEGARFSVNVANVDPSLVGEKNMVAVSGRGDANVVFRVGGVGEERLDDKGVQLASDGCDL
jgi:hypothetical protein